MVYSSVATLAILVQDIINYRIFISQKERETIPAGKAYFWFLVAVQAYYTTDALWGILDSLKLVTALYVDTVIYYMAMSGAVLLWTVYVIEYLNEHNSFTAFVRYAGRIFFAFEMTFLVINFFKPLFFSFDSNGAYQAGFVRYLALALQVVFFLLTSVYTFSVARKRNDSSRRRHNTVGAVGIFMVVFIAVQFFYPLLPLYSMGYMLGTCLLHTFVVEDMKVEQNRELEEALKQIRDQQRELGTAKKLVNTDPLTGVRNKNAYLQREDVVNDLIMNRSVCDFAVVVVDLNGLKLINDTYGHDAGDEYIKSASKLICDHFKHSPVYRIGGDEFAVVLMGEDHSNRREIVGALNDRIERNLRNGKVVMAVGISDYRRDDDRQVRNVFERADAAMYERKRELKAM